MPNVTYVAGVATFAAIVAAYIYQKKKKDIIPWKWEEIGMLTKVDIYPLKSGHRVELTKAECTEFGLIQTSDDEKVLQMRDRFLIVYAERDNEFRTARTYPAMMLIDVSVHDGSHLAIDAPAMRTLYVEIPVSNDSNQTIVKLHEGEEAHALDCGDEAAQWFSRYLLEKDSGLRLGYHDTSKKRNITNNYSKLLEFYKNLSNDSVGLYSDLSSILIVNQASVNDLNKRMGNSDITINNFRPNLVVDGLYLEPYSEDNWEWVKIGDVVMRNVKDCTRCMMTTIDPDKGVRNAEMEPLTTLKTYRISNGPQKLPVMGINLEMRKTGTLAIGDKVYVSRTNK